jgi:hypothetical protein
VPLRVDGKGDLVVGTDGGEVVFHKPVIYQPATYNEPRTKNQELVEGKYVIRGSQVTFEVANYDKTRPLVIDPTLGYSTYLGGSGSDSGNGIAVDASGNAYVTGQTSSSDFPTTPGAFQTAYGGNQDAFITKLNAAGSALLYSTYLGGSGGGVGVGIAVDASGNAYVTGDTLSSDFPTTPGAFQMSFGGGTCGDGYPCSDAFVTKLNADGSALVYSTYLGGSDDDAGARITVDASGDVYITGNTYSHNFPTTPGAMQTALGGLSDAFVSKLNSAGSALLYSTYLGGDNYDFGQGIAIDASGSAYVTGDTLSSNFPTTPGAFQTTYGGGHASGDAFVSRLNAAGSALLYSTYLGGSGEDGGSGIAVDVSRNAYVAGGTTSSDFPVTPGAFQTTYGGNGDVFVSKLNGAGSALLYSTYLGGSGDDGAASMAVDVSGKAYVAGVTFSSNFPTTPDAFQTTKGGAYYTAFVSNLNAAGSALLYSTYLRGNNFDQGSSIAVNGSGNVYITGFTGSNNFPTTPGAFQTTYGGGSSYGDAFISKFSLATGGPAVNLTPLSLTFAAQPVGTFSSPQQATLTNAGGAALKITNIGSTGDFALTCNCPRNLAAGASCTLNVMFFPTSAPGTRHGTVTINDNAPGSPHKLPLSGTASGSGSIILALSPPSLDFGSVAVGSTSAPQTVTVTNNGTVAASFQAPLGFTLRGADPKDFEEQSSCGTSLAPHKSCTVAVTFKPTASGARKGIFLVRQGAASVQIPLSGTGT